MPNVRPRRAAAALLATVLLPLAVAGAQSVAAVESYPSRCGSGAPASERGGSVQQLRLAG